MTSETTEFTDQPGVTRPTFFRERVVLELPSWRGEIWVDVPVQSQHPVED